jgi:uncharacterized protein (TIGR02996 family)
VLSFLRHAKEQPEDDTPRLVLSDWLEEHGGPADVARAEFVRVQCRLARLTAKDLEAERVLAREAELCGNHQRDWLGPLADLIEGTRHFYRGLVSIQVRGQAFASRRGLALADSEAFAWVDGLRFLSVTPRALATLAPTSLLGGLNTLSFRDCPLRGEGVEALAASPYLNQLTALDLHHCWIEDAGAAALAKAPASRLRQLDLYHNLLSSRGIEKLAAWPGLATVESLNLAVNRIEARGVQALVESPYLTSLRTLDLVNCFLRDEEIAILARAPFLDHLKDLRLMASPSNWALLRERLGKALSR